jgi:hypothetical protein
VRLAPLIGIEVAAFLLIIAETYAFFAFVVPLGSFPHNFGEVTAFAALKVVLTFGLAVLWFAIVLVLTRAYVRTRTVGQTPTPSS